LGRHCEFDRIDRTTEFGQHAISGHVDKNPPKSLDQPCDGGLMFLQRLRRAGLISPHEARIAGDVDRNDGGETAG
jgi:hypothetical protein